MVAPNSRVEALKWREMSRLPSDMLLGYVEDCETILRSVPADADGELGELRASAERERRFLVETLQDRGALPTTYLD